ncbi:DUF2599 domain-containing protein [Isoptericola croceus]|uniref:DUF2599 domain-containing protein n=1 Tax=Isoptericola croceus TaxID=3031406 RepID=UPI0023F62DD2|nr:DUF2599 domain-containing protein [Isoptericola croceus]
MPTRRGPLRVVRLLPLLLVCGLAGCLPDVGPPAGEPSGAASAPAPTFSAPPSPALTQEVGSTVTVRSGDVELVVSSSRPPGVDTDDASTTTVLDVGPDAPATLTVGGDRTLAVNADGTASVLDDGGTPVGGLTAPSGGARLVPVDDASVQIVSDLTGTATTALGSRAVAATDWGDREGGRSLAVTPTDWARSAGLAGEGLVWAELVAAEPEVDTASMRDQLTCHAVGAPDKPTWNLEPWRPDVGLAAVLAARCNPTG